MSKTRDTEASISIFRPTALWFDAEATSSLRSGSASEANLKVRRRREAVVAALEPVEASVAGPGPRANPRAKP